MAIQQVTIKYMKIKAIREHLTLKFLKYMLVYSGS
jgi:hypothetical protein